ncbi:MAG TPA: YMGG-like glycine zipper-containing protein [Thermoanaerobaculia bacterium]|jgi:hypothetical protein
MFKSARQPIAIALILMTFLLVGSVAAEARDTHGADRLVKGALIGAGVGAVTQVVRGRNQGTEILKGAAVGGAVGAAVGAYSDYRQERNARFDERRRADYYRHRGYRNSRGGYRDGYYRDDGYYPSNYAGHGRAHRGGGHKRCRR